TASTPPPTPSTPPRTSRGYGSDDGCEVARPALRGGRDFRAGSTLGESGCLRDGRLRPGRAHCPRGRHGRGEERANGGGYGARCPSKERAHPEHRRGQEGGSGGGSPGDPHWRVGPGEVRR